MLTQRQIQILKVILNQMNGVSNKQLSTSFSLSDRTIRSDINQINQELKSNRCSVQSSKSNGYYIRDEDITQIKNILEAYKEDEIEIINEDRIYYILGSLMDNHEVDMEDLADELYVSLQSISKDVVKLQKKLINSYNIDLFDVSSNHLKLIVHEETIRILFFKLVKTEILKSKCLMSRKLSLLLMQSVNEAELQDLMHLVASHYEKLGFTLSSESLYIITWVIYFTLHRNRGNQKLETLEEEYGSKNQVIHNLLLQISVDKQDLHENDRVLLSRYLDTVGLMKNNQEYFIVSDKCQKIMNEFVEEVSYKYCLNLYEDEEWLDNVMIHTEVMLRRLKEDYELSNPILTEIKKKFAFAYEIAMLIAPIIYKYEGEYLLDDEISYIAIYIEYFLQKQNNKIKAILVSGSGMGLTHLIKNWISEKFMNTIEILDYIPSYQVNHYLGNHQVDLVISTIPLSKTEVPIVYIDSIPGNEDFYNLSYWVKKIRISLRSEKIIKNLFHSDFMIVEETVKSFEEIIASLTRKLESKKKLFDAHLFECDVIEREKVYPTKLNEKFMIPHPLRVKARENAVAVAILRNGMLEDSEIRLIFLLALDAQADSDIDILFRLINQIGIDTEKLQEIITMEDCELFIDKLSEISHFVE